MNVYATKPTNFISSEGIGKIIDEIIIKDKNLLLVKGSVPGPDGGLVFIRSAAKMAVVEPVVKVGA